MGAALSTVFTKRNEVAYRNLAVISPKQGEDASSDIQDWANSVARQVDDSGMPSMFTTTAIQAPTFYGWLKGPASWSSVYPKRKSELPDGKRNANERLSVRSKISGI